MTKKPHKCPTPALDWDGDPLCDCGFFVDCSSCGLPPEGNHVYVPGYTYKCIYGPGWFMRPSYADYEVVRE